MTIMTRIYFAYWMKKATDTNHNRNIEYSLYFDGNNGFANAPQYLSCLILLMLVCFLTNK